MANPFDRFDAPAAQVAGGNPFDQFDTTRQDLQASGVVKQQQMPDLGADELARLPDNPAEFAQTLRQPNAKWVQRQYDLKEALERGGLTTFGASIGKGVMNIARGLGIADDATQREKERFAASEQQYPITTATGEVIGEAAPFAPLGVAAGAIPAFGARVAASGALGAAEGGIAALGRTGDAQRAGEAAGVGAVLGAGIEAVLPSLGRLGSAIFRRVSGRPPAGALFDSAGQPTAEMAEALQKAGVSLPDLQQAALDDLMKLPAGSSPEQAARVALFAREGMPYTKGDITQSLPQQATEARLVESPSDPLAQPFRAKRLEQSEKFRGALDDMASNLGVPDRAGESVKAALSGATRDASGVPIADADLGRKALMKKEQRKYYQDATRQAREIGGVPVIPDNIRAAVPLADLEDLAITAPGPIGSLDKLLVKYGLKETPEGADVSITPLAIEIGRAHV